MCRQPLCPRKVESILRDQIQFYFLNGKAPDLEGMNPPLLLPNQLLAKIVGWDFTDWMDPRLWLGVLWFQNRGYSNRKTPLSQIRNRKDSVECHDHLLSGEIFNFCKGITKLATIPSTHWESNSLPSDLLDSFANSYSTTRRSSLYFFIVSMLTCNFVKRATHCWDANPDVSCKQEHMGTVCL